MWYNTKSWKNKNIDLRMTKESEKMLIKDWITPHQQDQRRKY
jgi:hypothetical protein